MKTLETRLGVLLPALRRGHPAFPGVRVEAAQPDLRPRVAKRGADGIPTVALRFSNGFGLGQAHTTAIAAPCALVLTRPA